MNSNPMDEISVVASPIFDIFGFTITNTLLSTFAVMFCLIVIAFWLRSGLSERPGRVQVAVEFLIDTFYGLARSVAGSDKKANMIFPVMMTFFIFILFSNWFGLIPGLGSISLESAGGSVPLFRAPSTDLTFTFALSFIAMILSWGIGIYHLGWSFISKFITFDGDNIGMRFINFFVGLLELVSEVSKFLAFSFRLFGNIFAGEVLIIVIGYLSSYYGLLPFYALEIFVAVVQAFVFAILFLVFATLSTEKH